MGRDRTGDGVAAALGSDGLGRLQAGRRFLAELQAAYEAPEPAEERGRLIFGMLDGTLLSGPLFDVSDVAGGLDAESARCVLFAAAARLASGTAGYFSFAELITGELTSRDLGMTPADVRLLAAVSAPSDGAPDIGVTVVAEEPFDLMLDHVERLLAAGAPGAAELAEAVAAQAAWWKVKSVNRYSQQVESEPRLADLRDRALALAGYPPPPRFEGPVGLADGWGLAAARWLGPAEDWPARRRVAGALPAASGEPAVEPLAAGLPAASGRCRRPRRAAARAARPAGHRAACPLPVRRPGGRPARGLQRCGSCTSQTSPRTTSSTRYAPGWLPGWRGSSGRCPARPAR